MNTTVQAISLSELSKELENGTPASQLIDVREFMIRANPTKRTIGSEHERIIRGMKTVFISSYRRIRNNEAKALYEEKAIKFRDEIRSQMNNIEKDLDRLSLKWEKELEDMEVTPSEEFSNSVLIRVEVSSPEEHHFWQIIQKMDWLLILMENLWHHRKLSMESKTEVIKNITKSIYGLGINVKRHADHINRMLAMIYQNEQLQDTPEEIGTEEHLSEVVIGE